MYCCFTVVKWNPLYRRSLTYASIKVSSRATYSTTEGSIMIHWRTRVTHLLYCLIFGIFSLLCLIPGSSSSVRAHFSTLNKDRVHGWRFVTTYKKNSCSALMANVLVHVAWAHAVLLPPAPFFPDTLQCCNYCWNARGGGGRMVDSMICLLVGKQKYKTPFCFKVNPRRKWKTLIFIDQSALD